MTTQRFRLTVTIAALGGVLAVELLRHLTGIAPFAWFWSALIIGGTMLFTQLVFARLEATSRSLARQEQRMEQMIEATAAGIVLVAPDCRIIQMNPAAEQMTGYAQGQLRVCSDLFAPAADGRPICFTRCPGLMTRGYLEPLTNMNLQTKSGKGLVVATSVTPLGDGDFALLFWDVSERHRLEEELARRRRQVESLFQVGREMNAIANLDRNLQHLLEKARAVMEADLVAWGTLQESSQALTWQVVVGAVAGLEQHSLALEGTVLGRILGAGRPYVTQNMAADLQVSPSAELQVRAEGIQAAMAVPLMVHDRKYGVLFIGYRRRISMSDEDLMLLSNLGSHLAIAVENHDLLGRMQHLATLEERQRLARELHDSFGQTLTLIGVRLHLMAGMAQSGETADLLTEIQETQAILKESHQDVRRSIYQLKETGPSLAPLWERWTELLRSLSAQTGITVEMTGREAVPAHLPEWVERQTTRVIQEALNNIRNHSGAEQVRLDAWRDGHHLVIAILDDGCGFEQDQLKPDGEYHFGLGIMRERMTAIQGELAIQSEPGHGTTVRISVPITSGGGNDRVTYQTTAGR